MLGSEKVFTQETAGLVLYNVENACVHGLWMAVDNKDRLVHWKAVMDYADVPAHVYGSVISLAPFKQRYQAHEALAITKMLWSWKHPSAAHVICGVPQLLELSPTLAPSGPSSTRVATDEFVQQQHTTTSDGAPSPKCNMETPTVDTTSSRPAGAALPPRRQLPPHFAMLANRPGSGGGGGHKVVLLPGRVCTICKVKPSGWLVVGCKHMGPCAQCLAKPDVLTNKLYHAPLEYPVCLFETDGHVCGKPAKELVRVVM